MKIAPSTQPGEWIVRPADAVTSARPEIIAPPPAAAPPTPDKQALDEETRNGIRRLLRMVKKNPRDGQNRRKMEAYRFHADGVEPEVQRGQLLDKRG